MYYLDERLGIYDDGNNELSSATTTTTTSSSSSTSSIPNTSTYIPEVLVVGATGNVGRIVVRRLLLDGRFRVRVLVRDLYTRTLEMLGPSVTYCKGDLTDFSSLVSFWFSYVSGFGFWFWFWFWFWFIFT